MYQVWMGSYLLPVTPSKVNMTINNKNETVDLITGGEVNILKDPGLTTIDYECQFPNLTKISVCTVCKRAVPKCEIFS